MMPVGVEWKDPLRAEEAWENLQHLMPKSGLD